MHKITHSFYAGLGGHTTVFWAQNRFAKKNGFIVSAGMYGIEDPLMSTTEKLKSNNISFFFERKNGSKDIFHAIRHALRLRAEKADIIFMHGAYGVLFIYLLCCVFGNSKLVTRETQALTLKTRRQKFNSLLSLVLSSHQVFLSEDYRSQYLSNSSKKSFFAKTSVIPNGLDVDFFNPKVIQSNKSNRIIRIGMFSRIVPIKDYTTLIAAFARLVELTTSKLELLIAGDGTGLPLLKQQISGLGMEKHIKLLGLLEYENIPAYLNTLDIYVHSSFGETMSNSIMQAQSCGLPIVATDVFGINNVIIDQVNGFLFKLGDTDKLVHILSRLIQDEELRQFYGYKSREYAVLNLCDSSMGEKYYEIFNSLIRK